MKKKYGWKFLDERAGQIVSHRDGSQWLYPAEMLCLLEDSLLKVTMKPAPEDASTPAAASTSLPAVTSVTHSLISLIGRMRRSVARAEMNPPRPHKRSHCSTPNLPMTRQRS
jgi:hypothetical protein